MASIVNEANGRTRIEFFALDGKRRRIRLGDVKSSTARHCKTMVERILEAKLAHLPLDPEIAKSIGQLDGKLADKFAKAGLIAKREAKGATSLKAFLDDYIAKRTDVAPDTRRIWRQTARRLVEFFGANCQLTDLTRGDAVEWRLSLIEDKLAEASIRKHCGFAKHFLAQAVDHELIRVNPFAKLVSSPIGNEARQYFVSRDEIQRVLDAAPDAEWRLIIALSRYGGLRCPSEHLALRWEDINWEHERMHVSSPKTARHQGHEARIVPLFPELRPYLEEAHQLADTGAEHVINRYRKSSSNLRTQMTRIVKRAGLKPWPRIFHNLRSSRQTELEEQFASHVVCKWIGNSVQVARKHYLQVTEEHYQRAVAPIPKAARNAAQQGADPCREDSQRAVDQETKKALRPSKTPDDKAFCNDRNDPSAEVHGNRTHRPNVYRTARRF